MKEKRFLRSLAPLIMCILIFGAPLMAMAQQTEIIDRDIGLLAAAGGKTDDYLQGRLDGERDAKGNPLWILAGLGFGMYGVVAAYSIKPSPPATALMGKSPEYILGYTEGYKKKASRENMKYACGGALACGLLYVALLTMTAGLETTE